MVVPFVQGIPPELSCGGESVRRAARHGDGLEVGIELEHLRMGPGIRGIEGHINRNVPDELYSVIICVFFQFLPLDMEFVLEVLVKFDVEIAFPPVVVHGVIPALLDVLGPFLPGGPVEAELHSHKERVVLQPVRILPDEADEIGILGDIAALVGQVQQGEALLIDLAVVHLGRVVPEIAGRAFLLRQQALLDQDLQVDEIRIPRKGGEGLIGRIPVAGGRQGQYLPVALARLPQLVHEIICLL